MEIQGEYTIYRYPSFYLKMLDLELPVTTNNFFKVIVRIYNNKDRFAGVMGRGSFDMIILENLISGDEQVAREAISTWIKSKKEWLDEIEIKLKQ